jgi:hypothetical protein
MNPDIGFHVVSRDAYSSHGGFDEEVSVVQFFRQVYRKEKIPMNVTVHGLDDYVLASDDPESTCDFLYTALRDSVNHLNRQMPCVQFVVDEIEFWGEPVLPDDDDVPLSAIFGRNLEQVGAGWYTSPLNVTS